MSAKDFEIFNKDILSRLPGVGDAEVTEEENRMAKQVGRRFFTTLGTHTTTSEPEISIPGSFGHYRIFNYHVDHPPFKAGDAEIERKLDAVHRAGSSGNSMVVAALPTMGLEDQPICEGEKILVFLNGGGFATSDTPLSKWLYLRLSRELSSQRVFVPRYSTIPQSVFPRALYDTYTAYLYLVEKGFRPGDITFVAVSAGCNLAMATMLLLQMNQREVPRGCILISPLLDLTIKHGSWTRNQEHCVLPYVSLENSKCLARVYYGDGENQEDFAKKMENPLVSPFYGTAEGLPRMQIHVGECEVLLDEATDFASKVKAQGGCAELLVYPKTNHYTIMRGKTQLDKLYGAMQRFIEAEK
ncbi:hypothetical protein GGI25_006354 [Coemansia spiralis]|uniref:Alpha/beta hydrolase fold-3 domain-containing protein n=2 Tax=Coemansia TaxID=4863 RepID=A0A9W8KUW3_9FUNG|nr:hypothetical protein EDC05_006255 [Coemansia umbellata]KAJ2622660.1 hypothetical protein GGI26_003106 [Coemansia sp. RSA 1358]KAJ2668799.1 hypothetical protein GGI25_006354 [Coemansia spiralis]